MGTSSWYFLSSLLTIDLYKQAGKFLGLSSCLRGRGVLSLLCCMTNACNTWGMTGIDHLSVLAISRLRLAFEGYWFGARWDRMGQMSTTQWQGWCPFTWFPDSDAGPGILLKRTNRTWYCKRIVYLLTNFYQKIFHGRAHLECVQWKTCRSLMSVLLYLRMHTYVAFS